MQEPIEPVSGQLLIARFSLSFDHSISYQMGQQSLELQEVSSSDLIYRSAPAPAEAREFAHHLVEGALGFRGPRGSLIRVGSSKKYGEKAFERVAVPLPPKAAVKPRVLLTV
jgi:biotin carboxylase